MECEEPTPPQGTKRKLEDGEENGSKRPRLSEDNEVGDEPEPVDVPMEVAEDVSGTTSTGQKRHKYDGFLPRSGKRSKRTTKLDSEWRLTEADFYEEFNGSELELVDAGFYNTFDDDFNDDDLS